MAQTKSSHSITFKYFYEKYDENDEIVFAVYSTLEDTLRDIFEQKLPQLAKEQGFTQKDLKSKCLITIVSELKMPRYLEDVEPSDGVGELNVNVNTILPSYIDNQTEYLAIPEGAYPTGSVYMWFSNDLIPKLLTGYPFNGEIGNPDLYRLISQLYDVKINIENEEVKHHQKMSKVDPNDPNYRSILSDSESERNKRLKKYKKELEEVEVELEVEIEPSDENIAKLPRDRMMQVLFERDGNDDGYVENYEQLEDYFSNENVDRFKAFQLLDGSFDDAEEIILIASQNNLSFNEFYDKYSQTFSGDEEETNKVEKANNNQNKIDDNSTKSDKGKEKLSNPFDDEGLDWAKEMEDMDMSQIVTTAQNHKGMLKDHLKNIEDLKVEREKELMEQMYRNDESQELLNTYKLQPVFLNTRCLTNNVRENELDIVNLVTFTKHDLADRRKDVLNDELRKVFEYASLFTSVYSNEEVRIISRKKKHFRGNGFVDAYSIQFPSQQIACEFNVVFRNIIVGREVRKSHTPAHNRLENIGSSNDTVTKMFQIRTFIPKDEPESNRFNIIPFTETQRQEVDAIIERSKQRQSPMNRSSRGRGSRGGRGGTNMRSRGGSIRSSPRDRSSNMARNNTLDNNVTSKYKVNSTITSPSGSRATFSSKTPSTKPVKTNTTNNMFNLLLQDEDEEVQKEPVTQQTPKMNNSVARSNRYKSPTLLPDEEEQDGFVVKRTKPRRNAASTVRNSGRTRYAETEDSDNDSVISGTSSVNSNRSSGMKSNKPRNTLPPLAEKKESFNFFSTKPKTREFSPANRKSSNKVKQNKVFVGKLSAAERRELISKVRKYNTSGNNHYPKVRSIEMKNPHARPLYIIEFSEDTNDAKRFIFDNNKSIDVKGRNIRLSYYNEKK